MYFQLVDNQDTVVVSRCSAAAFADHLSKMFLAGFAFAYLLYCIESDGPIFLPTLSETWDFEPGNFVSRWVVGVGCVGLYLVQYIIFFADETRDKRAPSKDSLSPVEDWNPTLLHLSLISVFFLSVVGAVCSAEAAAECRGNSEIHYASAISFFVIYDTYMVVLSVKELTKKKSLTWGSSFRVFCVLASILAKVRFSPSARHGLSAFDDAFPVLAVIEWLDVGCIIAWTKTYTSDVADKFSLALVTHSNAQHSVTMDKEKIVWGLSGMKANVLALRYAVGTLLGCLVTAYWFKTISTKNLPFVSDTFVMPPGNYISRWAGIIGTTFLTLFYVTLWVAVRTSQLFDSKIAARLVMSLSLTSSFCLSLVMIISETEDKKLHYQSSVVSLSLINAFIILFTATLTLHRRKLPTLEENAFLLFTLWSCAATITLAKVRFFPQLLHVDLPLIDGVVALMEWIDVFSTLGFLGLLRQVFYDQLERVQLVILESR